MWIQIAPPQTLSYSPRFLSYVVHEQASTCCIASHCMDTISAPSNDVCLASRLPYFRSIISGGRLQASLQLHCLFDSLTSLSCRTGSKITEEHESPTSHFLRPQQLSAQGGINRVVITPEGKSYHSEDSFMTDSTFPGSYICCGSCLFAAVKATLQKGTLMGPGPDGEGNLSRSVYHVRGWRILIQTLSFRTLPTTDPSLCQTQMSSLRSTDTRLGRQRRCRRGPASGD